MFNRTIFALVTTVNLVACGQVSDNSLLNEATDIMSDEQLDKSGYQSFAFFEGLSPEEMRSGKRTDGTSNKMPCVTHRVIRDAEKKTYVFWHGHDNEKHTFTLSETEFLKLQEKEPVQVYTSTVDDHRHAVLIDPRKPCTIK